MRVYFDNAATTPLDPEVLAVMTEVLQNSYGNPSSIHYEGRQAKTIIEKARKSIASLLEVSPGEIFFTSGGTEADNMAIICAVRDLGVKRIITSAIEHHAVLHTVEEMEKNAVVVNYVNLTENGHIDLQHLESLLSDASIGKTLVSLMHSNNEVGNLLDVEAVGALCKKHSAFFHTDTVQTIGHVPLKLKEWGVHFAAAAGHKFNAPKGVGFIFINNDIKVRPFISGGAQERNMRGGTENISGIAAIAKALDICYQEMEVQSKHIQAIKSYFIDKLKEEIPGVVFNGDYNGRSSYTVLNVCFPPSPASEMLLFNLDIEGISASGGSACTSGSSQGSHVLRALNIPDGYAPARFSFGKYNTLEEVDFTISKLKEILKLQLA